jgi:hypothetical protein
LQTADGSLNVCIKGPYAPNRARLQPLASYMGAEDYTLNGLLRSEQGRYAIEPLARDSEQVSVTVLSSPEAIIAAHTVAMRRPSVDILAPMTTDQKNNGNPLICTDAVSHKNFLVANLWDWDQRELDLQPSEGPQAWFAMPPIIMNRITDRADEIMGQYGSARGYDATEQEDAAIEFAENLRNVAVFSRALYARILGLSEPNRFERQQTPRRFVKRALDINNDKYKPFKYQSAYPTDRYSEIFTSLGVISDTAELDPYDRDILERRALQNITALYIKHLAAAFIQLETAYPSSESEEVNQQKIAVWGQVPEWVDREMPRHAERGLSFDIS